MAKFDIEIISEKEPMIIAVDQRLLVDRMDPGFWLPEYVRAEASIWKYGCITLGELLERNGYLAPSDHVREGREEMVGTISNECDVEYYTVAPLMATGYDITELLYCNEIAFQRLKGTQVNHGDILIADSGVGGIGRLCFVYFQPSPRSCTGHLFVLHVSEMNPRYLTVFLKTRFGQLQIHRHKHGVGSPYLKSEDLLNLLVPNLDDSLQEDIATQHQSVERYHDLAMTAKTRMLQSERQGNERAAQRYRREYEENLRKAETMLANLVKQVEEIIEGKRTKIESVQIESKVEQLVEVR